MDIKKQLAKLKNFKHHENLTVVHSRPINYLLTKLRNRRTGPTEYMIYGDRLMTLMAEEVLCRIPGIEEGKVKTPCGVYHGIIEKKAKLPAALCCVSIVRSGDIMLESVRKLYPGIRVGKILIQRDENSEEKTPVLMYDKLPYDITSCHVLLVDPMLATGGSSKMAIDVLLKRGVKEENITLMNLIGCEEGLSSVMDAFPKVKVVIAEIDDYLNEKKYIVPGLGDYGDRYYGTTEYISSDDDEEDGDK